MAATLAPPSTGFVLRVRVVRYSVAYGGADRKRAFVPGAFTLSLARRWVPLVDGHEGEPVGIAVDYHDGPRFLDASFYVPRDRMGLLVGKTAFSLGAEYISAGVDDRGRVALADLTEVAAVAAGACDVTQILATTEVDEAVDWQPSNVPVPRDDYDVGDAYVAMSEARWAGEMAAADEILERLDREARGG